MPNDLQPRAVADVRAALDALYAAFTIAELRQMAMANDLSPLEQEVDKTYAVIAEIALALFLADLMRAGRDVGVVIDTTKWRIMEEQAHVRAGLARALADDQKRILHDIMISGSGEAAKLVAVRLRNALGLTQPLYEGVLRYERVAAMPTRRELETRDMTSPEQLAVMTQAYARDYRRLRADALGQVEAQRARGRADLEAHRQAGEQGAIDVSRVIRVWNVTGHNTRDSHDAMRGQERGLNEPFTSGLGNQLMYPGDGAAPVKDVANCNCWLTYKYRKV